MTAAQFDLYDLAWLAGGRRRAAQTAVAALVESGRVRVTDPTGDLQVVRRGAGHPVETAVLDALGARGHRGMETIVFLVRDDPRLHAVEQGLVRRGLVTRRGRVARAGRRTLRDVRRQPAAAGSTGSVAARAVALDGLRRVPAGLPPVLAERPPSRWSFTRRDHVDADLARIYAAGNITAPPGS